MERLNNFNDLTAYLSGLHRRAKVAVVSATDHETQDAVLQAVAAGFAEAWFVGGEQQVRENAHFAGCATHCHFLPAENVQAAAEKAVELVREGQAEVLMKGLLNTDVFLRAVLNKERGLLPPDTVLTHISCASLPDYPRLLFFSDAAVIPYPTQAQRAAQIRYMVRLCHALGIVEPRIALTHCSEQVNAKLFPFTVGYKDLIAEAQSGAFGKCIVDGPLDVKTSCDKASLDHKGITSPIDGAADALIFPDIEAGNAFYKTITLFGKAQMASVLQGTMAPVILTSRSDSTQSKFNSLSLAIGSLVQE